MHNVFNSRFSSFISSRSDCRKRTAILFKMSTVTDCVNFRETFNLCSFFYDYAAGTVNFSTEFCNNRLCFYAGSPDNGTCSDFFNFIAAFKSDVFAVIILNCCF